MFVDALVIIGVIMGILVAAISRGLTLQKISEGTGRKDAAPIDVMPGPRWLWIIIVILFGIGIFVVKHFL